MQNQIEPTPKQEEFITSTSKFTCMSGGFGSGKTFSGCLRGLLLSQAPGNFGLIGRQTYIELRDTTRRTFFEVCPPEYYDESHGGQWKPSENHLKLINGSEIIFRHLDTVSEKELLSLNLGWFYIDQAEEIGQRVFQILTSRLRLNTVPNRYGFITCNPEPGTWIDEMFRKPILEGKPKPEYHFIDSSSYDNPYLPPDYIPTLLSQYPEEMVKRFVDGSWDVFENQIYHEFDRRIHVIKPFEVPKGWERIVAVDHGMVNPTAAVFGAIDFDGNVFIYDEYYAPGIVSQHAKEILYKTSEQEISLWLIDPSTSAKTREKDGMPWSVMEEYEDYGLYFVPANNEKLAGINRVKEFLIPQKDRRHPTTRATPAPRLYIFQNCINLLQELPQYQWRKMRSLAQRNSPEQARDFNDHACFCRCTQVLTKRGYVPIIDVIKGDKVWTPVGWSKVLKNQKTGYKKVTTFRSTKVTENHPFLVQDGFRPLKDLRETDELWNAYTFAESHIGGILIHQDFPMQSILGVVKRATQVKLDYSIKTFGFFSKGIFRKVLMSIIKMGIMTEMILRILKWSLMPAILRSIWLRLKNVLKFVDSLGRKKQRNGIRVPMGGIFTAESVGILGRTKLYAQNIVITVRGNIKRTSQKGRGFAASTVKCQCSDKTEVYNLVTDTGMYTANNALVSNCDALRYLIMSRFPAPLRRPTGQEMILPAHRQNMNLMTEQMPKNYQGDELLGQFYGQDQEPLYDAGEEMQ